MGLPVININFFSELKAKKKRSSDGTVALILKDDTQTEDFKVYKEGDMIEGWEGDNLRYIRDAMPGGIGKVLAYRVDTVEAEYTAVLGKLKNVAFNYLAIPDLEAEKTDDIVTWIKARRKDNKIFKAVLANVEGDHESIINLTAEEIQVGEDVYTTSQYTPRVAGVLAGLPYTRSATYYVLDEVTGIKEKEDPDASVDNGELIFINDGEKIKIGRGVNSLTTVRTDEKQTEDFKSIRVMEILDMIHDEIYRGFSDNYIGQVPNNYDNQVLYFTEINTSFKELEDLQLLDKYAENYVTIDVDTQRKAWIEVGKEEARYWDEEKVKLNSVRRNVFLAGKIKVVETMEDLDIGIEI